MFKRISAILLVAIFCLLALGQAAIATEVFDLAEAEKGVLGVNYTPTDKKTKVMVKKADEVYYYDLNKAGETFPLQMGTGVYTFAVLENLTDNQYVVKRSGSKEVKVENGKVSFLQSANPVYWNEESKAVKLAKELTKELDTDLKKAKAIYNHIIKNIKYDNDKYKNVSGEYIPLVDEVLELKTGICYDYAALYAVMLRSEGIPTKLVKGYKDDIKDYHAWNEVYLGEKTGWVTVDTTYDAAMLKGGVTAKFEKNTESYKAEGVF